MCHRGNAGGVDGAHGVDVTDDDPFVTSIDERIIGLHDLIERLHQLGANELELRGGGHRLDPVEESQPFPLRE
jgi:hypothetical protein